MGLGLPEPQSDSVDGIWGRGHRWGKEQCEGRPRAPCRLHTSSGGGACGPGTAAAGGLGCDITFGTDGLLPAPEGCPWAPLPTSMLRMYKCHISSWNCHGGGIYTTGTGSTAFSTLAQLLYSIRALSERPGDRLALWNSRSLSDPQTFPLFCTEWGRGGGQEQPGDLWRTGGQMVLFPLRHGLQGSRRQVTCVSAAWCSQLGGLIPRQQ